MVEAEPTRARTVQETIEIGERAGIVVVASHIKARGANYWGSSHAAIQLIERARARGVAIYADQYPYTTSGSDGGVVLPPDWALDYSQWSGRPEEQRAEGTFAAALKRTLTDPTKAARLRQDIEHEISFRGGEENIIVFDHPEPSFIGESLATLAATRGVTPVEMAIVFQLEGYVDRPGGARLRSFSFSEDDIEAYARQPWTATASDGGITLPEDGPRIHARFYGTFPRKIRRYAMERGVISVEHAIRSATSLPAQILRLKDRGQVRGGFRADVAVLDLERLRDQATFVDPHQYSDGVEFVVVNGELVVERGEPTWKLPGVVIAR